MGGPLSQGMRGSTGRGRCSDTWTHMRTTYLVTVFLTISAAFAAVAPAVANGTCRARNLTQGTPSMSALQAAIDAADSGDTIQVKGVCVGNFSIGRDLNLIGESTRRHPKPVLDASGRGRVLVVNGDVALTNLVITGGNATTGGGGGIYHGDGHLVLNDSVVLGNAAERGGGILTWADITMTGRTLVRGNTATIDGGGIYNEYAVIHMYDSSSVRGNRAGTEGGGIVTGENIFMHDSSSVRGNRASIGGGVVSYAYFTMYDSSSVRGNRADFGGGIWNKDGLRMFGSSTITGNSADPDNDGTGRGGGVLDCGSLEGVADGLNVDANYLGDGTEDNIASCAALA